MPNVADVATPMLLWDSWKRKKKYRCRHTCNIWFEMYLLKHIRENHGWMNTHKVLLLSLKAMYDEGFETTFILLLVPGSCLFSTRTDQVTAKPKWSHQDWMERELVCSPQGHPTDQMPLAWLWPNWRGFQVCQDVLAWTVFVVCSVVFRNSIDLLPGNR